MTKDEWNKAFVAGKKADDDLAAKKRAKAVPLAVEGASVKIASPTIPKRDRALANYATAPTLESAECLNTAFEFFNARLFGGLLPPTMVRLQTDKRAAGWYFPQRFSRLRGDECAIDEIVLNPDMLVGRDDERILSTLVHEMCHAEEERQGDGPVKVAHTKKFREIMDARGLDTVIVDAKGNRKPDKLTGKNATHDIVPDGPFAMAFRELMDSGYVLKWLRAPDPPRLVAAPKKKKITKCKHECPECLEVATALIDARLICGACEVRMDRVMPEEKGD
jgi:ribosomal protein S27AE